MIGRPIPDDWYEVAPTITRTQARGRYGCTRAIVARWEADTGVLCNRKQYKLQRRTVTTPSYFGTELNFTADLYRIALGAKHI